MKVMSGSKSPQSHHAKKAKLFQTKKRKSQVTVSNSVNSLPVKVKATIAVAWRNAKLLVMLRLPQSLVHRLGRNSTPPHPPQNPKRRVLNKRRAPRPPTEDVSITTIIGITSLPQPPHPITSGPSHPPLPLVIDRDHPFSHPHLLLLPLKKNRPLLP